MEDLEFNDRGHLDNEEREEYLVPKEVMVVMEQMGIEESQVILSHTHRCCTLSLSVSTIRRRTWTKRKRWHPWCAG